MSSGKLIVVVGATGNQGGSVALVSRGAQVVYANIDDPSTLIPAFDGSHVIFAVSDYWGSLSDPANKEKQKQGQPLNIWAAEHETEQLKNIIDVAAKSSKGKYTPVYHFDPKGKAEDYGREKYPDLWHKASTFQAGFFLSNFVGNAMMQPVMGEHKVVQFINSLDPDKEIPFIAAEEDTGPIIKALVQEPTGQNIIGYRGWVSLREIVTIFTQITKMPAEAVKLPKGQLRGEFPPDLKIQLDDNWAYLNEFRYEGEDDTFIHPKDLASAPKLESVFNYMDKQDWAKVLGAV